MLTLSPTHVYAEFQLVAEKVLGVLEQMGVDPVMTGCGDLTQLAT